MLPWNSVLTLLSSSALSVKVPLAPFGQDAGPAPLPVHEKSCALGFLLGLTSTASSRSPFVRQGIVAPFAFVQVAEDWFSSNVRNASPLFPIRWKARCRNVFAAVGST